MVLFLVSTPKFYGEDYSHTNNEFGNAVGLYFHFLIYVFLALNLEEQLISLPRHETG
jgi:hypothetical protein